MPPSYDGEYYFTTLTQKFRARSIPKELRERPQWVSFDLVEKTDRKTGRVYLDKPPRNPRHTQRLASTTDPTTWSSFQHAVAVWRANPKLHGVGFVFTPADPYTGVDLDHCIKDGMIAPWAAEWVDKLGGYWEVSISGTGLHGIVKAKLPGQGRKNTRLGIEVYDQGRFFTISSRVLKGHTKITEAQAAIDELYRLVSPTPKAERKLKRLRTPALADDEVLTKARTAANGWKFKALYDEGDWQKLKYPSQSEADSGLVWMLAFWTGGDPQQIAALFEQSALYRDQREKRGAYVERTVSGALESYAGPYYNPKHRGEGLREALEPYFRLVDAPIWRTGKWPSARKVLAADLLIACEHGTRTKRGVRFGIDMRTLGQVAHVSSRTLLNNALPLLVKEGLIKWVSKGGGGRSSVFLLPLPPREGGVWGYNIHYPHAENVLPSHTLGNEERRELLRASVGRSPFAAISRVGNAKQVLLEDLVGTPGNRLTVPEMAEITGRRKPDVRRDMRALQGLNLVVEQVEDQFALADEFWNRFHRVLVDSGVIKSENERKKRDNNDRLIRAGWMLHQQDGEEVWAHSETGERLSRKDALVAVRKGEG